MQLLIIKSNAMKNLIYVFAVVLMGLVACGAPAEKGCAAECAKECCVVAEEAADSTATEEVADSATVEVVTEEVEAESAE